MTRSCGVAIEDYNEVGQKAHAVQVEESIYELQFAPVLSFMELVIG